MSSFCIVVCNTWHIHFHFALFFNQANCYLYHISLLSIRILFVVYLHFPHPVFPLQVHFSFLNTCSLFLICVLLLQFVISLCTNCTFIFTFYMKLTSLPFLVSEKLNSLYYAQRLPFINASLIISSIAANFNIHSISIGTFQLHHFTASARKARYRIELLACSMKY